MERNTERSHPEIEIRKKGAARPPIVADGSSAPGLGQGNRSVWTIGLTNALHPEAMSELAPWARTRRLSPDELGASGSPLENLDAILTSRGLPPAWLDRCTGLKAVVMYGDDSDPELLCAARTRGITCRVATGGRSHAVAEYVIGAMLQWERGFQRSCGPRALGSRAARFDAAAVRELRGAKLGIVGFGRVGSRIAEIAQFGFRMEVLAHTRTPERLPSSVRHCELEALFASCDYIAVCCSKDFSTRHLVGRRVLSKANPDLVLVNVSESSLIEEHALARALDEGWLRGAVLDRLEDAALGSPLHEHPCVLHTSRIAGQTREGERCAEQMAVRELLLILEECADHVGSV